MERFTNVRGGIRWEFIVGRDGTSSTFYASVWDGSKGPSSLLRFGTEYNEIKTVEELDSLLTPYGEIPDWIKVNLRMLQLGEAPIDQFEQFIHERIWTLIEERDERGHQQVACQTEVELRFTLLMIDKAIKILAGE